MFYLHMYPLYVSILYDARGEIRQPHDTGESRPLLNFIHYILSAYVSFKCVYTCDARGEIRQPHDTGESRPNIV